MAQKITVIGTGYVGLVAAVCLADFGNEVIGVDIDNNKVQKLNSGDAIIYEPGIQEYLKRNLRNERLRFTDDIENAIKESQVIFIGVGTPLKDDGNVDMSQIEAVINDISKSISEYKVIVTKSTVPIGTNRWIKQRIIENSGFLNFDIVSNPEFLREGKAIYDFFHPDRVVIGYESEKAKEIMREVYRSYLIETPFVWCNIETAELIKYASNAFLATKITFINQIANLSEQIGADAIKVAKAVGMDKRIGAKFLHPGPGFGGSCFPKDTKALTQIGKKFNVNMSLVEEVIRSNEKQKIRMVDKLEKLVGRISDKSIAVLGLAFKSETDDVRESPAIDIINELIKRKGIVKAHDPEAIENAKRVFGDKIKYYNDKFEAIKDCDAVIIVTEWNEYRNLDLERCKEVMKKPIILDTRNLLDKNKVKSTGFIYEGVGTK